MTNVLDNDAALTVLCKYDPQCFGIIDRCYKVKVYNFDKQKNSWVLQEQCEGVLHLIKRNLPPLYKFLILGKENKPGSVPSIIDIPISQYYVSECRHNFYMFKNESGVIRAIMFANKSDCDHIYKKVESILKEMKLVSEKNAQKKVSMTTELNFIDSTSGVLVNNSGSELSSDKVCNDDKILSLLESARQRYNDGQNDKLAMSKNLPGRRSRQIDINELFMTNNGPTPPKAATHSPAKDDEVSLCPQRNSVSMAKPQELNDNSPATMTVTELEKYFVQGASLLDSHRAVYDDSDDDDGRLLDPHMLIGTPCKRKECVGPMLSKEQLRETFIHMLQNDNDEGDGDSFLTKLHAAYVDLCYKRASVAHK